MLFDGSSVFLCYKILGSKLQNVNNKSVDTSGLHQIFIPNAWKHLLSGAHFFNILMVIYVILKFIDIYIIICINLLCCLKFQYQCVEKIMPIYFNLLCLIDIKLLAGGKLELKENLFNLLLTDCPIPSISSFFFSQFPAWIDHFCPVISVMRQKKKKEKWKI